MCCYAVSFKMLCFFFFLKSCPVSSLTVNDARSHFWSTRMMMRWINFSGTSYQSFVQNFFSYCRTITMIFSPHTIWKTFLSIIIVLPVAHWRSNRIFLISFIPPPKKLFSFFFFYFFCGFENVLSTHNRAPFCSQDSSLCVFEMAVCEAQ